MFIGHYAAALAAKSAEPRAPLWTFVAGCQALDIAWSALLIVGVEKVRFDPALPGSDLDLYFMPYSHSLPAALIWSVAAAILALWVLKLSRRAAIFVGLVVFSHWLLDFLVHRPDLELWFGGPKVGLAWWNQPVPEMIVEMGLLALAGAAWVAQRKGASRAAWPAVLFIAVLVAVQWIGAQTPGGGDAQSLGAMALATYLGLTTISVFVDRAGRSVGLAA